MLIVEGHTDLEFIGKVIRIAKAKISAISSILKPGKSTQVSIYDNRWITDATDFPALRSLRAFLLELLTGRS